MVIFKLTFQIEFSVFRYEVHSRVRNAKSITPVIFICNAFHVFIPPHISGVIWLKKLTDVLRFAREIWGVLLHLYFTTTISADISANIIQVYYSPVCYNGDFCANYSRSCIWYMCILTCILHIKKHPKISRELTRIFYGNPACKLPWIGILHFTSNSSCGWTPGDGILDIISPEPKKVLVYLAENNNVVA